MEGMILWFIAVGIILLISFGIMKYRKESDKEMQQYFAIGLGILFISASIYVGLKTGNMLGVGEKY